MTCELADGWAWDFSGTLAFEPIHPRPFGCFATFPRGGKGVQHRSLKPMMTDQMAPFVAYFLAIIGRKQCHKLSGESKDDALLGVGRGVCFSTDMDGPPMDVAMQKMISKPIASLLPFFNYLHLDWNEFWEWWKNARI